MRGSELLEGILDILFGSITGAKILVGIPACGGGGDAYIYNEKQLKTKYLKLVDTARLPIPEELLRMEYENWHSHCSHCFQAALCDNFELC